MMLSECFDESVVCHLIQLSIAGSTDESRWSESAAQRVWNDVRFGIVATVELDAATMAHANAHRVIVSLSQGSSMLAFGLLHTPPLTASTQTRLLSIY